MKIKFLKTVLLFAVAGGLLTISSCTKESGQGPVVTKTIEISDFSGVIMSGAEDVVIVYGPVQKVVAIGNENVISSINRSVEGEIWNMKLNENFSNYELRYEITVPRMSSIKVSGSANIISKGFIDEKDVLIDLPGSGNVQLENYIGTSALNIIISGSGNVYSLGSSSSFNRMNISFSGSGNYYGYPVEVSECAVSISGSGNVEVSVIDELNIAISGSGNVSYKGFPNIQSNISGSGNIINAN